MPASVPKVRKVAVIGAGISGVVAAKYLADVHFSVTVFERASSLGGIWVYDDRLPPDPPNPNLVPSSAEAIPRSLDRTTDGSRYHDAQSIAALQAWHAPPGPAYASLRNNIPTCLMSFKGQGWPDGTQDYIHHAAILDYVRTFARLHDVERLIKFNTRVSQVVKQDDGWCVTTCTLHSESNQVKKTLQSHQFDAIVVCSGHHSAPKVPDIPGLAGLKQAWPQHVTHSKSYRRPQDILGQNIVLVGNGASAYDIAHELEDRVSTQYQVTKVNSGYIPVQFMPKMIERVAEIAFVEDTSQSRQINGHIPDVPSFRVHLIDGRVLEDVHSIVLCTGYVRSYPFLLQYHDDRARRDAADDTVLITDGSMLHNSHKDIFYMPQSTLSFVGIPSGTTSLALFEYQAMAIASIWSGQARLPSEGEMRAPYQARLDKKGPGRRFHSLQGEEVDYVQEIVSWLNSTRPGDPIEGYSETWLVIIEKRDAWLKEIFSNPNHNNALKPLGLDVAGVCTPESSSYLAS